MMMTKKYLALFAWLVCIILLSETVTAKVDKIPATEVNITVTKANRVIQFSASTFLPAIDIVNVSWDFGDNTVASGLIVSHSFYSDGIYKVAINATDSRGITYYGGHLVMVGGWIPYYSNQAYLTMYLNDFPDGVYNLTVVQEDASVLPTTSYNIGGKFFTITSNLPNEAFSAELIIRYEDVDGNGVIDNTTIDERDIGLYYWNDLSWALVSNQLLNVSSNTITVDLNHFTTFALLSPIQLQNGTTTLVQSSDLGGGNELLMLTVVGVIAIVAGLAYWKLVKR